MNPVEIVPGDGPVVLGMPHTGTALPREIAERLNERGSLLADTDWHVDRLYEGLLPSATIVRATFHRYVIDANRDPAGVSLYPGQNTTGLCPVTDFDGDPIWISGGEPTETDIADRLHSFHTPYHDALEEALERTRMRHGMAILYDCHSIRSEIPFLFDGVLPDFNIGTNNGETCATAVQDTVVEACHAADAFTTVLNGRFKGGWTTRHYGRPENGIHAIQMELAQRTHLASEVPPFDYDALRASPLRHVLTSLLTGIDRLARDRAI